MKKIIILLLPVSIFILTGCQDLDLNPLSEVASENWFKNDEEFQMSVAKLYETDNWGNLYYVYNLWRDTDDQSYRTTTTAIAGGRITGQTGTITRCWDYSYECIANANLLLANIDKAREGVAEENLIEYAAHARFARAAMYSRLIFRFGDVPFYTKPLNIDEAFSLSRTNKESILDSIYVDFDFAIGNLPETYGENELNFATKGVALAYKARIALYMKDYAVARDAAEGCIDLNIYELFPDYYSLFLSKTKNSEESIFTVAYSKELDVLFPMSPRSFLVRTVGGFGSLTPSWDLLCSYLCTDGLPIDESPLFDPHEPFKNRDPRLAATIVEFDTEWLGVQYSCHPDTLEVFNYKTGSYISNTQNRAVTQFATYNGLALKKFIDESWLDYSSDNDMILMRYADVLLMYAEAKIELGEIDNTVLDAINMVRARAYGVDYTEKSLYPAVTTTDQSELRKLLRIERRMEFPVENCIRFNDLIRWRLAEKAITKPDYGLLDPEELREKVVDPGLWFLPETPTIDEDGLPDFTSMYEKGLIKRLVVRQFDASKHYLWPIPTSEIEINDNIKQNLNY